MKRLMFLAIVMMGLVVQAQDVITRGLGDFKEVKVFDKIEVTMIQGTENKIEITGVKRRDVVVKKNDDLLKIRMSLDNLWDNNNTKVTLYYTSVDKIDVNEGSKVVVKDILKKENLDLRVQEGATIEAKVEVNFLFSKAVSGGAMNLYGSANEQEVLINSGGQYFAEDLITKDAQVKVSAGGIAEVHIKNYIKANTNAGGTIKIHGNPREIDQQKVLGGKIVEVN